MPRLTGPHEIHVDDRFRAPIPAKLMDAFRAIALEGCEDVTPETPVEVVVGPGLGKSVCVFPKNVHQKLETFLESKPKYSSDWEEIRSMVIGNGETQTLDKQNRFRIPPVLARKFKLTGDIVIKGVVDRLELLSAEDWSGGVDAYMKSHAERIARVEAAERAAEKAAGAN
ncbi:hypothetical protein HZA57_07925 [Candidatus Poribacteria bacterium]|nr:hypothetical protein [Candidatus Poribacteria bacterium]